METNAIHTAEALNGNGAKPKNERKELAVYIEHQLALKAEKIDTMLAGCGISGEKFRAMAVQQLIKKPEIAEIARVNPGSFMGAVMEAAEQGLDFSRPNEAHLVPIPGNSDKGRLPTVALFRGYKGIAKMARRNPRVADVDAQAVFEKDKYSRTIGSDRTLVHEPPPFGADRGKLIGFYAIAYLNGAPAAFDEMSVEQVERHAKRFIKAARGAFGEVKEKGRKADNFEAYGLKTVLIRLCYRKLDLSSEMGQALTSEFETEGPMDDTIDVTPPAEEPQDINAKIRAAREAAKAQEQAPKEEPRAELELEDKPLELTPEEIAAEQEMAS